MFAEGRFFESSLFLEGGTVFAFYSNRLGCLGSIAISIIASALLFLAMRGCSGPM